MRDPKRVAIKIEGLVNDHQVRLFILADEEPTNNRRKFIEFCKELIARGLPDRVEWGIKLRVTHIMKPAAIRRDELLSAVIKNYRRF